MTIESLTVPDLGGAEQVEVIEILVTAGDKVAAEESIIVLETDKATMEIPSPLGGTILSLSIKIGDKLNEGDQYAEIETAVEGAAITAASDESIIGSTEEVTTVQSKVERTVEEQDVVSAPEASTSSIEVISVPDLGGSDQVEVIER